MIAIFFTKKLMISKAGAAVVLFKLGSADIFHYKVLNLLL